MLLPFGPSRSEWATLGRRLAGADAGDHEPAEPPADALPEPTDALPGSPDKLDVLEARFRQGQHLKHPFDEDGGERTLLLRIAWRIDVERNGRVGARELRLETEAREEPLMIRFLLDRCDAISTRREAQDLARACWGPDGYAVEGRGCCRVGLLRFPPYPRPARAEARGEGDTWPAAFRAALSRYLPPPDRVRELGAQGLQRGRGRPPRQVQAPAPQRGVA
jgi:hypothetical protein